MSRQRCAKLKMFSSISCQQPVASCQLSVTVASRQAVLRGDKLTSLSFGLCQGTTSVVPNQMHQGQGFSPCKRISQGLKPKARETRCGTAKAVP
jgi:hypothetical protein